MSIFSYSVAQQGRTVALNTYANKVTVVVNTASLCSFSMTNINMLNEIQATYARRGFTVLAFPCAQFANQEPLSDDALCSVWKQDMGIEFPIFDKISVKGSKADPLYTMLQERQGRVRWNYTKYVCDRQGTPVQKLDPSCSMTALKEAIEKLI